MGTEVNEPGGSLTISGLEKTYQPGRVYTVQLTLSSDGTEVAGFQAAVRFRESAATGMDAGLMHSVDDRTALKGPENGVTYVHQTKSASRVVASTVTWTFDWQAPETPSGSVVLHAAANSGNGDASPFGDLIYTASVEIGPGARPGS